MRRITAVLHAHSRWSYDGHWELAKIAQFFGAMGADAVLMSEHDTKFQPGSFVDYRAACAADSTRWCQLIPGIEYSSPDNDIHILTWGLDRFLAEHQPVLETLRAVRDLGGVAIFAHPVRRGAFRKFDPEWVPYLSGIEIWNRKSDGLTFGREAIRLIAETGLPATVGCDFHRLKHAYPLSNRFEIAPEGPLEPALIAAISEGRQSPRAFGRAVIGRDGKVRRGPHDRLEALRRRTIRLVRF